MCAGVGDKVAQADNMQLNTMQLGSMQLGNLKAHVPKDKSRRIQLSPFG
jgi:hypothetical protein